MTLSLPHAAHAGSELGVWSTPKFAREAGAWAARWQLPQVERAHLPVLALTGEGWSLRDEGGCLRFSTGMAGKRLHQLENDLLVKLGELRPGDAVLDCTLGLGADAAVAAHVVGESGRVVALEKSRALACLAQTGLDDVDVRWADHVEFLRAAKPKSFDVVLFDPMFGRAQKASPAFELLRRHADPSPLLPETLELARAVARRWVVVKGSRYSQDFKRLKLTPYARSLQRGVLWARL